LPVKNKTSRSSFHSLLDQRRPVSFSQHLSPTIATLSASSRATDPDADIVDLAGAGDVAQAAHRLMWRHGAAVYRYCCTSLRDAALADDVHQQIFIEAYRDLPRFGRRSTLRIWLFAIARHRVLDAAKHRRYTRRYIADEAGADTPDPRPSPAESIDEERLRAALIASLDELPQDARTAVLLHYQQGFTYSEMAEICRERQSTLHARVTRALPVLRRLIEARIGRGY
jgi:RNA polymerase sigma-70 factor (ECF subfamily)